MLPKFSIRQMLWGMVAIALLSLCLSSAWRGNRPAFGIAVAVIGSVIPLLAYAIIHWVSFLVALIPLPIRSSSSVPGGAVPIGEMSTPTNVVGSPVGTESVDAQVPNGTSSVETQNDGEGSDDQAE